MSYILYCGIWVNKIKATEISWIFFGMVTANASMICHTIEELQKRQRARLAYLPIVK